MDTTTLTVHANFTPKENPPIKNMFREHVKAGLKLVAFDYTINTGKMKAIFTKSAAL